ncbi:hypothetical protein Lal_00047443 [Lupinus albus]|nr:hypothetical protein Lal_00047443 [Lupinus albus]
MLLRGKATEDQLQFNPEIEKSAKSNWKKAKAKKKQGAQSNSLHSGSQHAPISDTPFKMDDNSTNTNDEQTNPPRMTLGDYAMYQGPRHYSSIVIPHTIRVVEIKPAFLNLISAHQFSGKDYEDPYAHLDNFYELVATMGYTDNEREAAYMMMFSFSLVGEAREWLKSHPTQSLTNWNDLESKFLTRFFPPARYVHAKFEISTFRQGADEAFYEAWERFQVLLRKCLNHGFEDVDQLNIFCNGLKPETKMILDVAAGGTMMDVDAEQATRIITYPTGSSMSLWQVWVQKQSSGAGLDNALPVPIQTHCHPYLPLHLSELNKSLCYSRLTKGID